MKTIFVRLTALSGSTVDINPASIAELWLCDIATPEELKSLYGSDEPMEWEGTTVTMHSGEHHRVREPRDEVLELIGAANKAANDTAETWVGERRPFVYMSPERLREIMAARADIKEITGEEHAYLDVKRAVTTAYAAASIGGRAAEAVRKYRGMSVADILTDRQWRRDQRLAEWAENKPEIKVV